MMRRLMTIGIMLLMLSSCYYFNQVVDDIKESAEMSERSKKNGSGAITNEKYKDGVKEAVKDILKRPLNKNESFKEIKLIIPLNTSINQKQGNIVDLRTGYGIPITFGEGRTCNEKKIGNNTYYGILYNEKIPGVEELAQKIIKVNGFVNTCE
jgi:putative liporotein